MLLSQSLPEHSELGITSALMGDLPAGLRKRHGWHTDNESLGSDEDDEIDLLDDEDELVEDEDDAVGCPLPSTPEDNQLLEEEVNNLSILKVLHFY